MKFYRYPLAIVSYALIGIFIMAYLWNWLGNAALEPYWFYFPAGAGIYLAIAFILSLLKLQWEWDVAVQVACVLAPVLWYVNIKEPYKRPVYMFIVKSGYEGPLNVYFNHDKDAKTNVKSSADTLYFKFDENGEILLNEDVQHVKKSMRENLYYLYPDTRKERILPAVNTTPADTLRATLRNADTMQEMVEGKVHALHYQLRKK